MGAVYLNGAFMSLQAARISPMDRGFLFGDSVYEVVPVYSRRAFRLDAHLQRLQNSLDAIRLSNPLTPPQWREVLRQLIAQADAEDQSVYLQVSRGPMALRNHAFPDQPQPTVFAMSEVLQTPTPAQVENGVKAICMDDYRWLRCDIKATSMLANCLLRQAAIDTGCVEALLLRDGMLSEGTASNIFILSQGVLLTPPKSHLTLPGITCDVVLELAQQHQLPCELRPISAAEVRAADEVWLTSSTREVLAIVELDGEPIGRGEMAGQPGPLYRNMYAWYQTFKRDVMRGD